ncbi:hypothetical protein Agub_g12900 [Astrephomene gubernaculifera]|uniref:PIH1 N-terminal domain-containing protein n=1 Tax=Astrephomene gubernaculifera TaxID=47775 RepID=A0AAD3DYY8_9CHLO|nr:hypothetical protein Agub_g12900 [Astrephomene gubernaculifera]
MIPQSKPNQPAAEEPMPSPEELLALVELLQQQGMNMDQVPPDLKTMLDNVKRQKAAKGGAAPPPDTPTEEITPDPGFVIKTSEVGSGRKVFINVCSSARVAAPGGWDGGVMPDEVAAALDKLQAANGDAAAATMTPGEVEALRFPLAAGPPRADTDRKGAPCTVIDVVFNADVVRVAAGARKLKALLIEVATGWVGSKLGAELDPRYKLPKMRYKGEVVASQRIRADDKRKKLVTELRDVDEEPSFALRTTKPSQQQQQQQQQAAKAGSSSSTAAAGPGPGSAGGQAAAAAAGKSGGATAAAATMAQKAGSVASSTAAAGAGGAAGGGLMTYKVEYEGRPVEWIRVTVDLPPHRPAGHHASAQPDPQHQASLNTSQPGSDVAVEVCGRSLFVRTPGHPELQVPLLFAASVQGATATLNASPPAAKAAATAPGHQQQQQSQPQQMQRQLVVRLPYRSLDDHLADARAQAPLAFGQLSFASKALLELEP